MNDQEPRIALLQEMVTLIARHEKWSASDFMISQAFLWIAIISSSAATILISVENFPKVWLAVLAALPALMMVADKTFRYRERSQWHELFALKIAELRYDLQISNATSSEIAGKLTKLRIEMHEKWPGENVSAIPMDPP